MAGSPRRFALRSAAFAVVAALIAACGGSAPTSIEVKVDGRAETVARGTTLAGLTEKMGLSPTDGRLLSVQGAVLDADADRGRILLNGRSDMKPATRLAGGDVVYAIDGHDRTEPIVKSRRVLPGWHFGDPELTLRRYRTREIVRRGLVSQEIVSTRYETFGKPRTPKAVALTFDDGPWPIHTERVLEILRRLHVKATFFMVGYLVERYPELVRKVKQAGMEIGNHSFNHPVDPALADLSDARVHHEIADATAALADLHVHPTLFRPPGGSYDDRVIDEARNEGMRVVNWSVDPQDWKSNVTSHQVASRVLKAVKPGSIVLMHDGGGDAAHTIRALPRIIQKIRKMGLKLVFVPRYKPPSN